ncbi:MAG: 4Fe-4S ferredoxin [Dissulfurispiraceae bacterium]
MAFEGCPGSKMVYFEEKEARDVAPAAKIKSELRQWPVQLHLVSPLAPYYQGADVLLSADCVAYALGNFHSDYLQGKALAIACPKLDVEQDIYVDKIKSLIEDANINTLTVMIMQVPCCSGLLRLAEQAAQAANRKVPIKYMVVGMQGEILQEAWI